MRMVLLTKVGREDGIRAVRSPYSDTDDPTEGARPAGTGSPVMVNVDAIRCFYPRRDNRPGTRITFTDGGGFAVYEPFAEVRELTAGDVIPAADEALYAQNETEGAA